MAICSLSCFFYAIPHLFVLVMFQLFDEVPDNFDFLSAVAAGLMFGTWTIIFFNNLLTIVGISSRILPDNRRKTVKICFVLFVDILPFPVFLLRFIFDGQLQKMFVRNCIQKRAWLCSQVSVILFFACFSLPPFPLSQNAAHTLRGFSCWYCAHRN